MKDLFGNEIIENVLLRDKFLEPPFTVLDTKTATWQARKNKWKALGIKSEIGRDAKAYSCNDGQFEKYQYLPNIDTGISIFDPALTELMYNWFCPVGGHIFDPFAGGSVRGIVAHYLGYKYTGVELRHEQVDSNRDQALNILPINNQPQWYVGDSNVIIDGFTNKFDFIFSCPPYFDLEVYSDLPEDLSNMTYSEFLKIYSSIILKSCNLLKSGCYACFVVGDVRDKDGYYRCLPDMTKMAFLNSGLKLYNEAILLNPIGTAMIRANNSMKSKKLVKVHQNVLIFKK